MITIARYVARSRKWIVSKGDAHDEPKDDASDWTDAKTHLPEFSRMKDGLCILMLVLCAHQTLCIVHGF